MSILERLFHRGAGSAPSSHPANSDREPTQRPPGRNYYPLYDQDKKFVGFWVRDPNHPYLEITLGLYAQSEKLSTEAFEALCGGKYRRVENAKTDLGGGIVLMSGAFLMLGDAKPPSEINASQVKETVRESPQGLDAETNYSLAQRQPNAKDASPAHPTNTGAKGVPGFRLKRTYRLRSVKVVSKKPWSGFFYKTGIETTYDLSSVMSHEIKLARYEFLKDALGASVFAGTIMYVLGIALFSLIGAPSQKMGYFGYVWLAMTNVWVLLMYGTMCFIWFPYMEYASARDEALVKQIKSERGEGGFEYMPERRWSSFVRKLRPTCP
jgi:hypothetical protein